MSGNWNPHKNAFQLLIGHLICWWKREHDFHDGGDWYICCRCHAVWKMPSPR